MAVILNALNTRADEETIVRRNRLVPVLVSLMCQTLIVIMRPHIYAQLMLIGI